jgi:hypothetical protein
VILTASEGIQSFCAFDKEKLEHAFGVAGTSLYDIANRLCESLKDHWIRTQRPDDWKPPFANAGLSSLEPFSARDAQEGATRMLDRTSTFHTLLESYTRARLTRETGIIDRVRRAIRRDVNAKHLAPRFNRQLNINGDAQPLKVDFFGQNYACYFLQVTHSIRGIEATADRAFSKLYALQALRRFVKNPPQVLGLLEDERPQRFELLMVGDRSDFVQRRAIYQIEALADQSDTQARIEISIAAVAERVSDQERLAV